MERAIEIIIHATDEAATRRLIRSLETVRVPEGFSAAIQPVTGPERDFAYETASRASDAKYKIFIDEDAVIRDENFLTELLTIFRDETIGTVTTANGLLTATQYDSREGRRVIGGDWLDSGDALPLVTIVIPTFNRPKFFRQALQSALNQTYRNIEVFISDNSTDDETERLVHAADDVRVRYVRHKNFDANDNWDFARSYNNPAAEFVNWLMDDDLFMPTKIERMVEVFRANPDVSLVTSLRHGIDADGKIFGTAQTPFQSSGRMSGLQAGRRLLTDYENFIGEPTAVLIRKKFLRDNDLCWHDDERGFFNLVDVSTWLQLLTQGDLYHIHEPLSCQRMHAGIASEWVYTPPLVAVQWVKLLKAAWDEKFFLRTEDDIRRAILGWFEFPALRGLKKSLARNYRGAEVTTLERYFAMMARALSNGCELELLPVEYSVQDAIKKIR